MVEVPAWDRDPKHAYPNVTLRLDFRGQDVGNFGFHCHILEHEDKGMMSIIQVVPADQASKSKSSGDSVAAPNGQSLNPTSLR